MSNLQFDWRWVAVILFVAILANGQRLPWPVVFIALATAGGYLLYLGWNVWNRGAISTRRVTYWRGQRIEKGPAQRSGLPPWHAIGPALLYLIIGGAFVLAALDVLLDVLRIAV